MPRAPWRAARHRSGGRRHSAAPRGHDAGGGGPRSTAWQRAPRRRRPEPTALTAEGDARLRAELDELTLVKRPADHRPHPDRQGARRPQGERRVPRRARGAVVPRGARSRRSRRGCARRSSSTAPARRLARRARVGRDRRRRRRDRRPTRSSAPTSRTRRAAGSRRRHRSDARSSAATTGDVRRSSRRPAASAATGSCRSSRQGVTRARRVSLGRLDQLVFHGVERGLCPRRQPELAEDVRDVGPGRPLGDEQRGADLLVAHPLPEQAEDVLLAIGQRLDELRRATCGCACAGRAGARRPGRGGPRRRRRRGRRPRPPRPRRP